MKHKLFALLSLLIIFSMTVPAGSMFALAPTELYSISGQVTDSSGNPVPGVLITATRYSGSVIVHDEAGNPVSGAQVFRNGILAGTTSTEGKIIIPDLQAGDFLVARLRIAEVATGKNNHSQDSTQNWGYRVYITSMDIPVSGEPQQYSVVDTGIDQVLVIKASNALIGFNIVASVSYGHHFTGTID